MSVRSCLLVLVVAITGVAPWGARTAIATSAAPPLTLDNLGGLATEDDAADAVLSDDPYDFLGPFGDNLRFSIDLASRFAVTFDDQRITTTQFVGIDARTVLSGPGGDWATIQLQPYLTFFKNAESRPGFVESEDDVELFWRQTYINFTGARGRANVKLGHFEVPYGIEALVDTNGTIRDYGLGRNVGVKADWGATLNGTLPDFEYEVSLSRGTGNEWSSRGDPWLVAGRIGTPRERDIVAGFSFARGEIQRSALADGSLRRSRFGLDLTVRPPGPLTFMGELSVGTDEGDDVLNALLEVDWENPSESWLVYGQARLFRQDFTARGWDDQFILAVGARWRPDSRWTLSAQWQQDVTSFDPAPRDGTFIAQARLRF